MKIVHPVAAILRGLIQDFMGFYALTVCQQYKAGQDTATALIDGLSGVMALQVAGGHGSREEIEEACIALLRANLTRDLQYLARR